MTEKANIVRFNRAVLGILAELYDTFPTPAKLEMPDLASRLWDDEMSEAEQWEFYASLAHAITWLSEEGFLRYSKYEESGTFWEVRLSMKGLLVLGSTPKALKEKTRVVDRVKSALSKGTEKAASDLVGTILGSLAKINAVGDISGAL